MGTIISKHVLDESLGRYTLRDLMSAQVLSVYEGWSVKQLADFFVRNRIPGAPVLSSDGELVGVVSQADVVRFQNRSLTPAELARLAQYYCGPAGGSLSVEKVKAIHDRIHDNSTVFDIMTREVVAVDVSASAIEACSTIVASSLNRLFVTDQGKLVGVVTAMAVLKTLFSRW